MLHRYSILNETRCPTASGQVFVATRPATVADGIDLTVMKAAMLSALGGVQLWYLILTILGVTADSTFASPTGGAGGPELWGWGDDGDGTKRWQFIAYAPANTFVKTGAMTRLIFSMCTDFDRICLATTVTGGAPLYSVRLAETDQT